MSSITNSINYCPGCPEQNTNKKKKKKIKLFKDWKEKYKSVIC